MTAEQEEGQLAVIEEHDDRASTGPTMSTGKMDPHATGWTRRIGVGRHPPERTPCSERVCALEKTISTRRSWEPRTQSLFSECSHMLRVGLRTCCGLLEAVGTSTFKEQMGKAGLNGISRKMVMRQRSESANSMFKS